MKRGLLIILGLWSCTGSHGAAVPLIVDGAFEDQTNAALGLLTGAGGYAPAATNVMIDLPLPSLGDGGEFVLGLDCAAQPERICGARGLRCYRCTAYGESASGRPEDFVAYGAEVVRASRCTAVLVAKDPYLSGVVTDPRGYKYEIKTLLPPVALQTGGEEVGYGYEGIRVADWDITVDYMMPEQGVAIPIDPVVEQRALLAVGNDAPKSKPRERRLLDTDSSHTGRANADDDGTTITLLYYLTKRAMCQWTGQEYDGCVNDPEALVTMVGECTTYGNLALADSKVDYVYETVHIHVDEDHDEGTSASTSERLAWITASATAHALRDEYAADLVVEVFYMAGWGAAGIGWVPTEFPARAYGFSSQAGHFSIIDYIIAHEVGHNMGLNHNREQVGDKVVPGKSFYGYNDCAECFMTIMSYSDYCKSQGCTSVTSIPYFSNVDVKYTDTGGNFAMGTAESDCSATLDLSKVGVAQNRFTDQLVFGTPRRNVSFYKNPGKEYLVFYVTAIAALEITNVEFLIGGAMQVGLYTAEGAYEGKEWDDDFWGEAHVLEDVIPSSDTNSMLNANTFASFPPLALAAGTTYSFRVTHEKAYFMYYAAASGEAGDIYFENDHLQVTVGAYGVTGYVYTNKVGLYGALLYTLDTTDTSAPTPKKSTEKQRKRCIALQNKAKRNRMAKITANYKKWISACKKKPKKRQKKCKADAKKKRSAQAKVVANKAKSGIKNCNKKWG